MNNIKLKKHQGVQGFEKSTTKGTAIRTVIKYKDKKYG